MATCLISLKRYRLIPTGTWLCQIMLTCAVLYPTALKGWEQCSSKSWVCIVIGLLPFLLCLCIFLAYWLLCARLLSKRLISRQKTYDTCLKLLHSIALMVATIATILLGVQRCTNFFGMSSDQTFANGDDPVLLNRSAESVAQCLGLEDPTTIRQILITSICPLYNAIVVAIREWNSRTLKTNTEGNEQIVAMEMGNIHHTGH